MAEKEMPMYRSSSLKRIPARKDQTKKVRAAEKK
jgi:hypothetical protein